MATETTRLRSTAEHHGAVAVAIHWASAALGRRDGLMARMRFAR